MTKEHILSEIKRTAEKNGAIPLGIDRFREATGIRKEDWYGILWTKWSDAQIEAGLEPNQFSLPAFDESWMLNKIIDYIRELGHFPSQPEFKIKRHNNSKFPNLNTLKRRLGTKQKMIKMVLDYCKANDGFNDIIQICSHNTTLLKQAKNRARVSAMIKKKLGMFICSNMPMCTRLVKA